MPLVLLCIIMEIVIKKMQWKEKKNTMYLLFYGLEESWIIKNQSFADAA